MRTFLKWDFLRIWYSEVCYIGGDSLLLMPLGYVEKQILEKQTPKRPLGYLKNQISEKPNANMASWIP